MSYKGGGCIILVNYIWRLPEINVRVVSGWAVLNIRGICERTICPMAAVTGDSSPNLFCHSALIYHRMNIYIRSPGTPRTLREMKRGSRIFRSRWEPEKAVKFREQYVIRCAFMRSWRGGRNLCPSEFWCIIPDALAVRSGSFTFFFTIVAKTI